MNKVLIELAYLDSFTFVLKDLMKLFVLEKCSSNYCL